jgi:hypothetical protein
MRLSTTPHVVPLIIAVRVNASQFRQSLPFETDIFDPDNRYGVYLYIQETNLQRGVVQTGVCLVTDPPLRPSPWFQLNVTNFCLQ